jgi:formamidopyrimidine-DNA glycosylase
MPELPEVETTCRGIRPHLFKQTIRQVIVRNRQLRWPVSNKLVTEARNTTINSVERRAKYLIIYTDSGSIIIHLGMSGSLRITHTDQAAEKHDHIDIILDNDKVLRFRDPRRFGSVFWTRNDPLLHKRLVDLGPEPFSKHFSSDYMHALAQGRKQSIKAFIMNSHIVVGVGNIYACEALFLAGINPNTAAGKLSAQRWQKLVDAIIQVLRQAIEQGGTTLRDFTGSDGQPGYFAQSLNVYGREHEPCLQCQGTIRRITQGQRSTFYCTKCQH